MRQEALQPHEIRCLRRTMGLTQAEFGDFFGRDAATIFRWENGHYEPDAASKATLLMLLEDVRRELRAKGVDPDDMTPKQKPDDWKDVVGKLILGGIFVYLIAKVSE